MVRHKIYCDRCGKELNTMRDFNDLQIDLGYKWTTVDLCAECLDKLYEVVCEFCTRRSE